MADLQIRELPLQIDPLDTDLAAIQRATSPFTTYHASLTDIVRRAAPGAQAQILYTEGVDPTNSMRSAVELKWNASTPSNRGRLSINASSAFAPLDIAEDDTPLFPDTLVLLRGTDNRDKVNIRMQSESSIDTQASTTYLEAFGEERFNFYQGGLRVIGNLNSPNISSGDYELLRVNPATGYLSVSGTPITGGNSLTPPTIGQAQTPLHIFFAHDPSNPGAVTIEDSANPKNSFIFGALEWRREGNLIARQAVYDERVTGQYESEFYWQVQPNTETGGTTGVLLEAMRIRNSGVVNIASSNLINQTETSSLNVHQPLRGGSSRVITASSDSDDAEIMLKSYNGNPNTGGEAFNSGFILGRDISGGVGNNGALILGTRGSGAQFFQMTLRNDKVLIGTNITSEPNCKLDIRGTDALQLPVGTAAERPSVEVRGMIRWLFDTPANNIEVYDGSSWGAIGGLAELQDRYIFASNLDNVQIGLYYGAKTFNTIGFDTAALASITYETSTDGSSWTNQGSSSSPGTVPTALNTFSEAQSGAFYLRVTATYQAAVTITTGIELNYQNT